MCRIGIALNRQPWKSLHCFQQDIGAEHHCGTEIATMLMNSKDVAETPASCQFLPCSNQKGCENAKDAKNAKNEKVRAGIATILMIKQSLSISSADPCSLMSMKTKENSNRRAITEGGISHYVTDTKRLSRPARSFSIFHPIEKKTDSALAPGDGGRIATIS